VLVHAYSVDLATTATAPSEPVVAPGQVSYTLTASNRGPDAARDVHLVAALDAHQTLRSITCVASGGAVCSATPGATGDVPVLPKDGVLTYTVVADVAADASGALQASWTATAAGDVSAANDAATAAATSVLPNSITLQSDTGDYIGAGRSYAYTRADSAISLTALGGRVDLTISGDQDWNANFALPSALTQLQVGTYTNLQRYPFHVPADGGLDWFGEGRGCNQSVSTLQIQRVLYVGGTLKELDLTFEQHCEFATSALHGQIHWTAYDKSLPPGPIAPPPAGLWTPAAGIVPATGNYVYLQSDSGDYIGAGGQYLYTPGTSTINVTSNGGGLLSVGVDGWTGAFLAMSSVARLQPGYYGNLERYPFNNPARGALSWSGNGRGCNTLSGWFVVDAITYTGVTMTSIDLRFEQHCEGFGPALHGAIHWAAP